MHLQCTFRFRHLQSHEAMQNRETGGFLVGVVWEVAVHWRPLPSITSSKSNLAIRRHTESHAQLVLKTS